MTKIDLPPQKKVGHLTLLREPRSLTPKEYNALSPEERLEIIRRSQGNQKYDLIIEAADAEALVKRLPAQEVYLLIKERGLDESGELLRMASTDQVVTFFDLDLWDRETLKGDSALAWLTLLLEEGEEIVLRTLRLIDIELLVLMIKKFLTVIRGPEDFEEEDLRDGGYEVEYHDSESGKIVGAILDIISHRDHVFSMRLLAAVRWEQEALLEEDAYRFRIGRLQDHGFADPFEALAVHAYLEPDDFDIERHRKGAMETEEKGVEAPGFVLTAARPRDLLAEILAGGVDQQSCWELTFLLNKVMSADRSDLGSMDDCRLTMEEVYLYVNLGLEHLSGGDSVVGARLFGSLYLQSLYRLGYSLTLRLQRRAKALSASSIGAYLDGPFRALVDALGRRKPRFFEGIDEQNRGGERPFANLRDIRLAGEWLERLDVQRTLFEEHFPFDLPAPEALQLEGCAPGDAEDLALSDFFLTSLANRLLGREFLPLPVPKEEIAELHGKVCVEGKLFDTLRHETVAWLESLETGAGAFGNYCLDLWVEEFCCLNAEKLDPRYVSGLIVRLG